MSTLGDDLDKLAIDQRRESILARRLKEAKDRRIRQEHEVYDRMVSEGWNPGESSFVRNGIKFRPVSTDRAVVQDAEALRQWLRGTEDDELADAGIVEDKFKQKELNAIVRAKLDNEEPLPPGLGYFTSTTIHKSGIMAPTQEEDEDAES